MDTTEILAAQIRAALPGWRADGLPERFWDVVTRADMTEAEASTYAYDYRAQEWIATDHAHIDPLTGESLFCGADWHTCAGLPAPFVTHECWEHETVQALRDLRDGRTVCASPEHDAQGCADTLEQREQSLAMVADMYAAGA